MSKPLPGTKSTASINALYLLKSGVSCVSLRSAPALADVHD